MTSEFQADYVQPIQSDGVLKNENPSKNEPMVSATEMREFFQANKRVLDKDQNGFVNLEELNAFKYTNGKDFRVLQELKNCLPQIEIQSNDEWGAEDSGISDKDIEFYEAQKDPGLIQKTEKASEFADAVKLQFRFFDRDNSGSISIEELNSRKSSNYLDPQSRDAAAFVFRNFDAVRVLDGGKNDGISKESLARVAPVMFSPFASSVLNGRPEMRQTFEESRLSMWRSLGGVQR